ncbi:DUF1616 domain-containing protein [Natronolimnohabitans sp. A-GB9]|uniref:DUF1616 domain-containing protein n=1 Tax=Natronolimnohabitans sp. A-GB9 TaxID=3069757 RepID=UPI0027AFA70A|nr:DUF1616 domain-containing protein [Natronolimnohabitans sp. A-GB9]MDQ2052127.1 DUF1616 domain-containing protein [Natronolimnohabitans sp. A-GB9]
MSHETSTLTRFSVVRQYPFDLAVVSVGAILAYGAVTSLQEGSVARLLATFPLALFLPGYALVSVLFPAGNRSAREATATTIEREPRGIDVVERLGLSVALSLAVVPVVGLVLPLTQWGLATVPAAATLTVLTVVLAQLGVVRRLKTPTAERFTVSPLQAIRRLRREENAVATASSIVLVLAIGLAAGALLVGFLAPVSTGGFTELALYTEDEDGELIADNIDGEIGPNESIPVTVSIDNQEGEETDYTVVVQEQSLEDDEIVEQTELEELETTLDDETTGYDDLNVAPTATEGETVRISVLLFEGEAPSEPTNENADEDTYFWVTVEG